MVRPRRAPPRWLARKTADKCRRAGQHLGRGCLDPHLAPHVRAASPPRTQQARHAFSKPLSAVASTSVLSHRTTSRRSPLITPMGDASSFSAKLSQSITTHCNLSNRSWMNAARSERLVTQLFRSASVLRRHRLAMQTSRNAGSETSLYRSESILVAECFRGPQPRRVQSRPQRGEQTCGDRERSCQSKLRSVDMHW